MKVKEQDISINIEIYSFLLAFFKCAMEENKY